MKGEFDVEDNERRGRPNMFEDAELLLLLATRTFVYVRSHLIRKF